MTVLVALVGILAAGYVALQFRESWERAQSAQRTDARWLEEQRIEIATREITLKERLAAQGLAAAAMPPDLLNRVRMWDDPMAQDAERATIRELYEDLGDWDSVRRHLVPLAPSMTTEIVAPRDGLM